MLAPLFPILRTRFRVLSERKGRPEMGKSCKACQTSASSCTTYRGRSRLGQGSTGQDYSWISTLPCVDASSNHANLHDTASELSIIYPRLGAFHCPEQGPQEPEPYWSSDLQAPSERSEANIDRSEESISTPARIAFSRLLSDAFDQQMISHLIMHIILFGKSEGPRFPTVPLHAQ